jgi:hypothetical protein
VGGERAGGVRWAGWAARVKWWAGLVWVFCLVFPFFFFSFFFNSFLSFPFQTFTQNSLKIFKPTFKPHNQSKAHAFNMMHNHLVKSKLINYYCIYLKANLIIQIH